MEATQESTQPCTDPRRMGYGNSGLHDQDVSDLVCILHPNSLAAHEAVAATATVAPQHILQRDELEHEYSDTSALDIALRMSSNIRDLGLGFTFGRSRSRCDILLADDSAKRVSNMHFRIYLTGDGIIMLEDTSTNGTLVDNYRLQKRLKDNSRMLTSGSVIEVVNGAQSADEIKFVVRVPSREGFAMPYTENMMKYLERIQKYEADTAKPRARQVSTQPFLPWTVANGYGMHWTGGTVYNVTGQIGKGAFATVYKVATKQHGTVYAAKELDKRRFMKNGILDQKVDNEMKIMRDLKHPNIVQYIDHHEHDRWIYIIMEYVAGGELSTYLQSHGKIPEDMVRCVARQILHALQYLHKRKITHRDIKPDNILISSLDPLRVKLSDFGLSKVVQEETFLKTFCGTLLYCAPEVYPEYETYRRGEARKRRRLGDPPPKTSPYSQSVDMWSLGAVLYHILVGTPPFMPRPEERGPQMLRVLMTNEIDFSPLRNEGISESGIDFVGRLLNRDPRSRPKEQECFQHPWIAEVPDVDDYEDDCFQSDSGDELSVIGEDPAEDLDPSQLSLNDDSAADDSGDQACKRPRIEPPPAHISYPSLPKFESVEEVEHSYKPNPNRLFGEIPSSALRSSNVLGAGGDAFEGEDISFRDFASSTGESMHSEGNSINSVLSLPEHRFGDSAPSLMGAENRLGELNVNSTWHPGAPYTHQAPETPTGQPSPGDLTDAASSNRSGPKGGPSSNDTTPKAKFNRLIQIDMSDNGQENSKSKTNDRSNGHAGDFEMVPGQVFDIELATTVDAETGKSIRDLPVRMGRDTSSESSHEGSACGKPQADAITEFSKPRPVFGKLTSLPGSIANLTIRLEDRLTSWGRGRKATVRYPDEMDFRIPMYALEVTFWTPGIEARIKDGEDWTSIPATSAILSTKTREHIWVNDTKLSRGSKGENGGEAHFGKLYSGDIITVYRNRDRGEFLKFQCDFFHGDSARPRPVNEKPFVVRKVPSNKSSDEEGSEGSGKSAKACEALNA